MKYFIRHKVCEDGRIEEVKVSKKEAIKQIDRLLERDKEMLEVLAKL
ncbi:MAG: hypothetical protein U9Q22_06305 [Candidatus Altiarchaeota archaeon]|nr:hypothetical protein [Candidatus Altiarchaeota archaeon]